VTVPNKDDIATGVRSWVDEACHTASNSGAVKHGKHRPSSAKNNLKRAQVLAGENKK
jgi:hypothetical protein